MDARLMLAPLSDVSRSLTPAIWLLVVDAFIQTTSALQLKDHYVLLRGWIKQANLDLAKPSVVERVSTAMYSP
jgi:hypothetical protein